jgi:hypothetical protein
VNVSAAWVVGRWVGCVCVCVGRGGGGGGTTYALRLLIAETFPKGPAGMIRPSAPRPDSLYAGTKFGSDQQLIEIGRWPWRVRSLVKRRMTKLPNSIRGKDITRQRHNGNDERRCAPPSRETNTILNHTVQGFVYCIKQQSPRIRSKGWKHSDLRSPARTELSSVEGPTSVLLRY